MSNKLLAAFGRDPSLENEGVWVEILTGVQVKLCAIGNTEYKRAMAKLSAPYKSQIRNDKLPKEIEEDLVIKAIARTVLVDWDGVQDPTTNEVLPYSYENCYNLLKDPRLIDFRNLIMGLATERETYRLQEIEDAEKNLDQSSDGNTSGTSKRTKQKS